jgi:GNAT superfamily N-acetyltransferase
MEEQDDAAGAIVIRSCHSGDRDEMLAVINTAAGAYRGLIPEDHWHEPYMPADEFASEVADGVVFSGCVARDRIVGVMAVQRRYNVDLIRHAYVLPRWQGRGIGSILLGHLRKGADRPILIGTWAAAEWAIRFYERHGFARVSDEDAARLLRTYWNIPEGQIATSIVLASPELGGEAASQLMADVPPPPAPG